MAMDKVVEAYTQDLRNLLKDFHSLESNKNATYRDFARVSEKIREVCRHLDDLARKGIV